MGIYKDTYDLFKALKSNGFSKLELMVMDSAVKGMPLENLDKTLLIIPDEYDKLIEEATSKMIEMIQNEPKPALRRVLRY